MVLGEAANNITCEFAAKNPEVDWKGLAGVRHKIVHDYADIDYDTIRQTTTPLWDDSENEKTDNDAGGGYCRVAWRMG